MTRALALLWLAAALLGCSDPTSDRPAVQSYERVVTLAPNLTELVFAIGAGERLVGVSAWSDYPPEVIDLPVVGDAFTVDQEQLALLNPDLLLVWESGTPAHTIDELRKIGYRVESIRTRGLEDIGTAMIRIGELTGRLSAAEATAADFSRALEELRQANAGNAPITVFYQVSARPLYTINREHYVSELIQICGGTNVFDDLNDLAPTISVEAVLDRNPEVMLASTDAGDDGFTEWRRWPAMHANMYGNQFLLPANEIARGTPRLIVAGGALCLALQQARINRDAFNSQ